MSELEVSEADVYKPTEPHLALLTKIATVLPIPIGATLFLVYGLAKHESLPVILAGVSRRGLTLRCACGDSGCTRVGKANIKWEGSHPYRRGT